MQLDAHLHFSHLNTRTEKHGDDDHVLAVDVKLEGEVGQRAVRDLFSTDTAFSMLSQFFTSKGDLKTADVSRLELGVEGHGCKVTLKNGTGGELSFGDAKVNKVRMAPKPGDLVELSLRVQVSKPSEQQIGLLARMLDKPVRFTCKGRLEQVEPKAPAAQDKLPLAPPAEQPPAPAAHAPAVDGPVLE